MNSEEMKDAKCPLCGCRMKVGLCMSDAPIADPYQTVRARLVYDCRGCGFVGSREVCVDDPDGVESALRSIRDSVSYAQIELSDIHTKLEMLAGLGMNVWDVSENLQGAMNRLDLCIKDVKSLMESERERAAALMKAKAEMLNAKMKEEGE